MALKPIKQVAKENVMDFVKVYGTIGGRCGRCEGVATIAVELCNSIDNLCAGCATVVIRDGIGIILGADGVICNAIRITWHKCKLTAAKQLENEHAREVWIGECAKAGEQFLSKEPAYKPDWKENEHAREVEDECSSCGSRTINGVCILGCAQ